MPISAPLDWYAALTPAARVHTLRALFNALDTVDPCLRKSLEAWHADQTIRLECNVVQGDIFDKLPIHLIAEGGSPKLIRTLRSRLDAGTIKFEAGRAIVADGQETPSLVASLGVGVTLVAREMHGELVFSVSDRPAAAMPIGLTVGQRSPFPPMPDEGFLLTLFHGQLHIVGGFRGLRRTEILAAKRNTISLGLVQYSPNLMILGLNVPGLLQGWADLPFAMAIEPPERREWRPSPPASSTTFILSMVDTRDQRVHVVRALEVSDVFAAELNRIIDEQILAIGNGYGPLQYNLEVMASRERWPHPNMMEDAMTAQEIATDVGR